MIRHPPNWILAPQELILPDAAVHLWLAKLDVAESYRHQLAASLSTDEIQRAEKFVFEQHREHFVVGRGILRHLLGRYTGLAASAIRFNYNSFGKPSVRATPGQATLHFNVSHANGMGLFAFSRTSEIGVDIEFMNESVDIEQTGALVFSPHELSLIQALPPALRRSKFFQFWSRKEALIKAVGQGLSLPLRQIDISQAPEKAVVLPDSGGNEFSQGNWFIKDIHTIPGFSAAIAAVGKDWAVAYYRLPEEGCLY